MMNDFLRYKSAVEPGDHPHWDMVLDHCGNAIDKRLKDSEWGQDNGILTGGRYLTVWIASILRNPEQPLPYLFFHGNQNCGKSMFNEAIGVLLTRGYIQADWLVARQRSCWNDPLDGAILCYLDETDLTDSKYCDLDLFKDMVISTTINIHKMREKPYLVPNLTHWCQTANTIATRPTCLGDRIITILVDDLVSGTEIMKRKLLAKLHEEAPHFMQTLMQLDLPPLEGQLGLPVLKTK